MRVDFKNYPVLILVLVEYVLLYQIMLTLKKIKTVLILVLVEYVLL